MSELLEKAFEVMKARIGEQTSQTEWFEITQDRVNEFAEVTMDRPVSYTHLTLPTIYSV